MVLPSVTSRPRGPSPRRAEIVSGKRGYPSALVINENGEEVYLHSLYDPVREAEVHVPTEVNQETLVFLGTGIGYHVSLTLNNNPHIKRVVLVERYPELAAIAASSIESLALQVDIVTTTSNQPSKEIIPTDLHSAALQIVPHPPSLHASPLWYAGYHAAIATAGLQRSNVVRKNALTILFLFGAYYGQRECIRGFQALGHRVVSVDYRGTDAETLTAVQKAITVERPDLVFSINLRGLDTYGVIGDMLARTGIPLSVWFVDSPEFILSGHKLPPPDITTFFLWDRSYLSSIVQLGYRAYFLPLAADPLLGKSARSEDCFRSRISFVGNSLVSDFLSRLAVKFPQTEAIQKLMSSAVSTILDNRGKHLEALDDVVAGSGVIFPDREALLFFRAYAVHSATTRYRTLLLERLLHHGLTFFGDPPGWQTIFGHEINVKPDVHYYSETPAVYASSEVNFNATSLQMPETVNQRVFDVPLCGGFLLTDRQVILDELFAEDERAVYEGGDDVAEKALYYLARPAVREKITRKARKRVLKEHTYRQRMGELLRLLRV